MSTIMMVVILITMAGLNKVLLIGNTTRDTELRKTETGKSVANMRLATNRRVHGSEQTLYHTVICWDGLAETVARFAKKGRQVYVEGRLEHRMFTDEEGRERGTVEIVASDVQFLGSRTANSSSTVEHAAADESST
ncbi:MAG: single-stranded DNA-binding protein [Dehalococcoidia bacterium]|nr:single-stranded DNA-binding protein [Dehalococcoidia bacterium]